MALDDGLHGSTEIRVHGVSGTPPESILSMPAVWTRLVHGTETSGFYRRWLPGTSVPPAEPGVDHVEAYSWGGLTSGTKTRSLWLIVLPFTLIDLGHWMLPLLPQKHSAARRAAAGVSVAALRLMALTITLTAVLAFSLISLDLSAWQCADSPRCASAHGYVGWLAQLDRPGQRVAVAALLPALLLAVAWFIGHSSAAKGVAPSPVVVDGNLPLKDSNFFDPDPGVIRLRRLHVICSASLLSALVVLPIVKLTDHATWPTGLLGFVAVLGLLAALTTCSQRIAGRGGQDAPWAELPTLVAQVAAVIALVLALGTSFFTTTSNETQPSHLPGLRGAILVLFVVQLVLIPVLVGTVALQHDDPGVRRGGVILLCALAVKLVVVAAWALELRADGRLGHPGTPPIAVDVALVLVGTVLAWVVVEALRRTPKPVTFVAPTNGDGPHGMPPVAAGGLGAPLVAVLAWLYSVGLSAGLGLQVAQYLGHPVTSTAQASADNTKFMADLSSGDPARALTAWATDTPLIIPPGYIWAGVGAVAVALVALGIAAYVVLRSLRRRRDAANAEAEVDYAGVEDPTGAAAEATKARAIATLTDDVGVLAGLLVGATLLVGFVGVVAYLTDWQLVEQPYLAFIAAIGSWLVVAFVGALLALGYASLRNRSLRRSIGILWDVCTFWPRANHPFTPPPYSQRAVPQLLTRITSLTDDPADRVVLSCHSQGSVIAVPVVLRLGSEHAERLSLLLHGSPVLRLYARWFPAYFCAQLMLELGESVTGRWRTLYRRTDYIGGWNETRDHERALSYAAGAPRVAAMSQRDQEVPDPPLTGGAPRRHSDYWLDPIYTATVQQLFVLASVAPAQPPRARTASASETIPAAGASSVQE